MKIPFRIQSAYSKRLIQGTRTRKKFLSVLQEEMAEIREQKVKGVILDIGEWP